MTHDSDGYARSGSSVIPMVGIAIAGELTRPWGYCSDSDAGARSGGATPQGATRHDPRVCRRRRRMGPQVAPVAQPSQSGQSGRVLKWEQVIVDARDPVSIGNWWPTRSVGSW